MGGEITSNKYNEGFWCSKRVKSVFPLLWTLLSRRGDDFPYETQIAPPRTIFDDDFLGCQRGGECKQTPCDESLSCVQNSTRSLNNRHFRWVRTPPWLIRSKLVTHTRQSAHKVRKSGSHVVLSTRRRQLSLHATRRPTPHGASRLVHAMSVWQEIEVFFFMALQECENL